MLLFSFFFRFTSHSCFTHVLISYRSNYSCTVTNIHYWDGDTPRRIYAKLIRRRGLRCTGYLIRRNVITLQETRDNNLSNLASMQKANWFRWQSREIFKLLLMLPVSTIEFYVRTAKETRRWSSFWSLACNKNGFIVGASGKSDLFFA